jgi:hypothetical protein
LRLRQRVVTIDCSSIRFKESVMVTPVAERPAFQPDPAASTAVEPTVDAKRDTERVDTTTQTPGEALRSSPTTSEKLLAAGSAASRLKDAPGTLPAAVRPQADSTGETLTAKSQATGSASAGISASDTGPEARADLQAQLRLEAKLNAGTAYGDQLSAAADQVPGSGQLTDGSYRDVRNQSQDRLRSGEVPGQPPKNPLEIATWSGSPDQAAARVKQFDQQIEAKENDAKRWAAVAVATLGRAGVREAAQAKAEAAQLGFDRGEFINNVRLQSGKDEDGKMYQAVAASANPNRTPVIFVNGINTDVNRSRLQALELSDRFDSPVNHIVNVSSKDKLVRAGIGVGAGGALREGQNEQQFDQRVQQHLAGNRPASTATANAILDQLYDPKLRAANAPVKVVGYSQGAAIASQALRDVDSYLNMQMSNGTLSYEQKLQMLHRVRFLGIGPATADRHLTQDYRKGGLITERADLAEVNYRSIADKNDQIANLVGVGRSKASLVASAEPARKLAQNDFHAHLSYFRSYEAADPGSIYNPQVGPLLDSWFSGQRVRGLTITEGR